MRLEINLLDVPVNDEDLLYGERVSGEREVDSYANVVEEAKAPKAPRSKCISMSPQLARNN